MKEKGTKIALLHHVGGGNLGDDATLEAVVHNIRLRWPEADIEAITMNPDDTEMRHGITSHPIRSKTWIIGGSPSGAGPEVANGLRAAIRRYKAKLWPVKWIYALTIRLPRALITEVTSLYGAHRLMKSFDRLIICGGGQLTGRDGPWAFPYTLLKWVLIAGISGVKSIFLNVGAGPLSDPLSKAFSRRALSKAEYVTFRDPESMELARAIGFTGASCVFPDNAYSFNRSLLAPRAVRNENTRTVGFAPVPFGDPRLHRDVKNRVAYERFLEKCAGVTSWLNSRQYQVLLFGTDIGVDPLADADLIARLRGQEDEASPRCLNAKTVQGVLEEMSSMEYIITCRFHGVIFAHLLNKPVLAIAHHPKVTDLMKNLGLARYCVDIRTFDPGQVANMFESLVIEKDVVKAEMAKRLAKYQSQLASQFDELFPPTPLSSRVRGVAGVQAPCGGVK